VSICHSLAFFCFPDLLPPLPSSGREYPSNVGFLSLSCLTHFFLCARRRVSARCLLEYVRCPDLFPLDSPWVSLTFWISFAALTFPSVCARQKVSASLAGCNSLSEFTLSSALDRKYVPLAHWIRCPDLSLPLHSTVCEYSLAFLCFPDLSDCLCS
jgi:hypothetical protein